MKEKNKQKMKEKKQTKNERKNKIFLVSLFSFLFLFSILYFVSANVQGPSSIEITENRTKGTNSAAEVNISGGYISVINMTAVIQDSRWKAFVGWINGRFTLDDASGSTIFDWSLTQTTGNVYSTRVSSTINWNNIVCASLSDIENENIALNHTSPTDNITTTFTKQSFVHSAFLINGITINAGSCPGRLATYVNNNSQTVDFQEIITKDSNNYIIYATKIYDDKQGYNGQAYDFQMLVPEVGLPGYSGSTAYYLYVELI